ncbi:MAG TPA: TorF family putative porin, partial [Herbaspirillum sp.]
MKKIILATAIALTLTGNLAYADEAAAPVPDNALSFNIGAVNDYRFRGISQTRFDPAVQGGADYVYNPLGLYAGTWLSNIKWIKDTVGAGGKGNVEWDIYGG